MEKKGTQVDEKKTGERIFFYLQKSGMSLHTFAGELDVTVNAVRNYVNGINLPRTEKMYKICKILNVDIKDIIVEKDKEQIR